MKKLLSILMPKFEAKRRINKYRQFVKKENPNIGKAYSMLHKLFNEKSNREKNMFFSVASGNEQFLYNH